METTSLPPPQARSFERLLAFFPNAMAGVQVGYTCASLATGLARDVDTHIYTHALIKGYRHPLAKPALPPVLTRWGYRYLKKWLPFQSQLERQYLNDITADDLAWIWPGRIVPLARQLKVRGIRMIEETINCHQATAREILNDAYRRLGWPSQHRLTDQRIKDENDAYALMDAVFSPHPCVTSSLLAHGVPETKIIGTSFGWAPELMPAGVIDWEHRSSTPYTVVFVGTLCVRKGTHLLVRAWRDADVSGSLRLVGWLAAEFHGREAEYLAAPGVERLGGVPPREVGKLMRAAHVFAFPTLEESGPQVTYEAASQGLAIVTTPMGAGAIIRDGVEGIVLDPYDHDAWVQTLRRLHDEPNLRRRLGEAAQRRAQEFTWERVAQQRMVALETFFRRDRAPTSALSGSSSASN